nr:ulp1 protease family, C-terminal catalytic domain-containing protein [Tanacetum cinerariifolium]
MKPEHYKKFRSTVFGLWLDIRTQEHDNHLINYFLQHQRYVKDPSTDIPYIFDIGQHTLEFGRREFCLVTGFYFGKGCLDNLSKGRYGFGDCVFPGVARFKGPKVYKLLNSQTNFNNLLDDHDVRGQHIQAEFHNRLYNNDHTVRKGHLKKIATLGPTYLPIYTLQGFVFPLKTSSTKDDSHVDNVFSDTSDFDHDASSFSRFTENPVDRAALINKITDVRVDFQRLESDVDNQNVDNHSMDFDHDPKTSFKSDVDTKSLDNHSMDVDHDPTQMHNQLPTEPMNPEATVQGRNNVKTEQSINIEYESQDAIHDQFDTFSMKNVDFVQGVPLERDHKVSRYLQDPYMIQPDSTEPNHKDLFRLSNAPKTRFNVPKEIINFLWETKEQYFYFPWSMDGTFVYNNFWQGLLRIGKERRGWLSDMHLDLWVLYMWHFRLAKADWAIAGPFFNTFMLRYELPCCYANGITYDVPWFAQYVEKVRCSYILPPNDLTIENQKWWLEMRACYASQIPKIFLKTEVLDKKNIDPANYSITYRYAVNVPRQGDAYGDCGIWVMCNMYRLVNNLSLDVSNPTQLGLAYRERVTDFFSKYKIPVKQ